MKLNDLGSAPAAPAALAADAHRDAHRQALSLSRLQLLVLAALGAGVSVWFTGFVFGVDNNAFHLPIVASMFDEPQFRNDTFVQSLRYFSSGVWLLLRGSAKTLDPYWLFACLDYLSRVLSFVGFLLCASLLGVRGMRRAIAFTVIICFASVLQGEAAAGDGGLFLNYFTHSEIANGTILIGIYWAVRARLDLALVFLGATIFVNVFMGIWLIPPLVALSIAYLLNGRLDWARLVRQALPGAAVCIACALPVVYNIVSNPEFGKPLTFDYLAYTIFHYPYHMLPAFTPRREYFEIISVTLLALLSLVELRAMAAPLRIVFATLVAMYLLGMAMPSLTSSPLILNIHLLRSGALFYLMAGLSTSAVAVSWLFDAQRRLARVFAPLLIVSLCSIKMLLPVAIACIALKWLCDLYEYEPPLPRLDWLALGVLLLAAWPSQYMKNRAENANDRRYSTELAEIGDWARQHTATDAVFLMPTELQRKGSGHNRHLPPHVLVEREIVDKQGAFVYHAHRRLRGSFKEGAAVMWTPSFYREWRPDVDAALQLRDIGEKIDYAKRNGIDYVLASCLAPGSANYTPVMRTADVCAYATKAS